MKTQLASIGLAISVLVTPVAAQAQDDHAVVYVKDSAITAKVKAKLAAEHLASVERIQVDTDRDGVVWLSGSARSPAEIDRVVRITRDTEGVRDVKNHLVVRRD